MSPIFVSYFEAVWKKKSFFFHLCFSISRLFFFLSLFPLHLLTLHWRIRTSIRVCLVLFSRRDCLLQCETKTFCYKEHESSNWYDCKRNAVFCEKKVLPFPCLCQIFLWDLVAWRKRLLHQRSTRVLSRWSYKHDSSFQHRIFTWWLFEKGFVLFRSACDLSLNQTFGVWHSPPPRHEPSKDQSKFIPPT